MGKVLEITPGVIAWRVGKSVLLGMTVGALADLLTPVRRKIPVLTDLLLSIWIIWTWLEISFRVCNADVRMGYCTAAALGALFWRIGFSPLLRPILAAVWMKVQGIVRIPKSICKIFLEKMKKTLSIVRKIGYNRKSKMPK